MSRVSRLAEIRRRREGGRKNEGDQSVLKTDEPRNGKETRDEHSEVQNLEDQVQSVENHPDHQVDSDQEEHEGGHETPRAEDMQLNGLEPVDQETLFRNIYNQTGVLTSSLPEQAISYNSDLKEDLQPLYTRARHTTDRAINKIIQEKYRQSLGEEVV